MLVLRAQGGDRKAFDRLTKSYRGMVLATAIARLHAREEAEDLAQDILTRAWMKLPTLKDATLFAAWLRTLALRTALNRQSRRPPTPPSLTDLAEMRADESFEGDPVARCLTREHQRMLYAALKALPLQNRLAILLHVCEGYTCEELASLFGVPLTTIEGRVHRAKGQLRRLLGEEAYHYHHKSLER
ncbi:MAG: RNA polymerase sigma factor [Armatimonadota bacterium]